MESGVMETSGGLTRPNEERLFFALWPAARVARILATAWPESGTRNPEDYHMTLAFLGATSPEEKARLMAQAGALRGAPFTLRFGRLAYWEGPGVLVLEPLQVPPAALRLAEAVQGLVSRRGRPLEPYRPHVTLARPKVLPEMGTANVAVDWAVRDFVLARANPAAMPRYTILARWPLDERSL